jgi:glutaredoxin
MKKVTLFTLSTCPWCKKAKQYFTKNKIPFEFKDYDLSSDDEQEEIMDTMNENGGTGEFPFVIIGKDSVCGYDPDEYARLLGKNK